VSIQIAFVDWFFSNNLVMTDMTRATCKVVTVLNNIAFATLKGLFYFFFAYRLRCFFMGTKLEVTKSHFTALCSGQIHTPINILYLWCNMGSEVIESKISLN